MLPVSRITRRRSAQGKPIQAWKGISERFSQIVFPEADHKIADVLFYNFALQ